MPIDVVCPGCRAGFQARSEWAGKRTKCPECGAPLVIEGPENGREPPPAGEVVKPPESFFAIDADAASNRRSSGRSKSESNRSSDGAGRSSGRRSSRSSSRRSSQSSDRAKPDESRIVYALAAGGKWLDLIVGSVVVLVAVGIGSFFYFRAGDKPTDAGAADRVASSVPPLPALTQLTELEVPVTTVSPADVDLADIVERLKSGVILLTMLDSRGEKLGLGSGFLIAGERRAVTNYHVIGGGYKATVRFSTGDTCAVKSLVAVDQKRDLAIVELESVPAVCKPLQIATDAVLRQGTKVIAIGHPEGYDYSVTEGIISAVRTTVEVPYHEHGLLKDAPDDQQWIQTTAAISHGNSGGPLMLPDGQVIGINTWGNTLGQNLNFAGHARYLVDLMNSTAIPAGTTIADYNKKHGGLERAAVGDNETFAESQAEALKKAEEADWKPKNDEIKKAIRKVAAGTAYSRPRGVIIKELRELAAKLNARKWDYKDHVQALNEFTIDTLSGTSGAVMFFGRVVKTFEQTDIARVQIVGRGYFVEIFEYDERSSRRKIGEEVLVLGIRPPSFDSKVPSILAGIVLSVKCPLPPADTTLAELRDYVHYETKSDEGLKMLADGRRNFPQIRFKAGHEPQQAYTLTLNATGGRFDALRLLPSSDAADDDLVWSITVPREKLGRFGITSLDGLIPTGIERFVTVDDYQPTNLKLPLRNVTLLVHVSGQELKESERHLLWFEFLDDQPVELTITGVYRKKFIARPQKNELFASLGLPEVAAFETRRRQYAFSLLKFDGVGGDDRPTVTGEPLVPVTPAAGAGSGRTESVSAGSLRTVSADIAPGAGR